MIIDLRKKWAEIRSEKLRRKQDLLNKGFTVMEIRKDREFRHLKKEQKKISTLIRHQERKHQKKCFKEKL